MNNTLEINNLEELAEEERSKKQDYEEDEEELSECCGATILDDIWLCSDCKEPC